MKSTDIEWDLVQWSLLAALLCGLIGFAAVSYSGGLLDDAYSGYQRHRNQLNQVARDYRAAQDDRVLYEQYVQRFAELQDRGVIGEEQRLAWVELLREINDQLKLPVLRYEIHPRQPLPIDHPQPRDEKLLAYETSMTLSLGVLHEGDLFTVEHLLRERAQGLFETRGCEILRPDRNAPVQFNPRLANLEAHCQLSWYTVQIERSEDDR